MKEITIEDELLLASYEANDYGDALSMKLLYDGIFCCVEGIGYLYFDGEHWTNDIVDKILYEATIKMILLRKRLGLKYGRERLIKHSMTSNYKVDSAIRTFKKMLFDKKLDEFVLDEKFVLSKKRTYRLKLKGELCEL